MKKNIVYLYSELMGYQIPVFEELVNRYDYTVHVIHSIQGKMSKYVLPEVKGIFFYTKEDYSYQDLKNLVLNLNPQITYVSGWMYFDYIKITYELRKENKLVVSGFDDLWLNTIKQRIARVVFPFFRKLFFSHAWVAGPFQYEFARNIGFSKDEIIFNCLSADTDKFNNTYQQRVLKIRNSIPHNFLYVGRFQKIKGIDILVEAWKLLSKDNHDWSLTVIGNGPAFPENENITNLHKIDFMQPEDLVKNLHKYSCLIIPSRKEQWSVVMHEFAAAGFPIICSSVCGAIPMFVIPGYNGFVYQKNDVHDLANKMRKIINSNDKELLVMSENSHHVGQRITPSIVAASLMSIIVS